MFKEHDRLVARYLITCDSLLFFYVDWMKSVVIERVYFIHCVYSPNRNNVSIVWRVGMMMVWMTCVTIGLLMVSRSGSGSGSCAQLIPAVGLMSCLQKVVCVWKWKWNVLRNMSRPVAVSMYAAQLAGSTVNYPTSVCPCLFLTPSHLTTTVCRLLPSSTSSIFCGIARSIFCTSSWPKLPRDRWKFLYQLTALV